MNLIERFLHYVSFHTTSAPDMDCYPSTERQLILGEELVRELKDIGATDVRMDSCGYVYGTIPSNLPADAPTTPTIGFFAHMDTAPDYSGENVKPRTLLYEGGDIVLNEEKGMVMREADFPSLKNNIGKHLIVTDGTTLLGADDKAGIAEIMTMAADIIASDRPHGEIHVAFMPDEEVGNGTKYFNLNAARCDYAYTCDGGTLGELNYENFNAASGRVVVHGFSIHPGEAKGKMKNAARILMEFEMSLPETDRPEKTEGHEGFFHLHDMGGNVEEAWAGYIIREHDAERFAERKALFCEIGDRLNAIYGPGTVEVTVTDSYYNMRDIITPRMDIIDRARAAMQDAGITPMIVPIRGGTDGAQLSYKGLPCPNLCTGGENFHGPYEYIPIEDMEKCVEMLKNIAYRI